MKNKNYYGSDLNKFIDEECTRKMTCNNLDCYLIKVAYRRIRFIESKHTNEGMANSQRAGLQILEETRHVSYDIEVFIVRGEYPYHTAVIEDLHGHSWTLSQNHLRQWLNFEAELE